MIDRRQRVILVWAGLAVVLSSFGGSVLIVGLPAIARDFHAGVQSLTNLGSVLTLGALGALPLSALADHYGRRRLIAVGVLGFSLANFGTAFATSIVTLGLLRVVAVCFEVLVASVATALIVEEAPETHRGEAVSLLSILSGGGLLIAIIVYPIVSPHWRWLFEASGVGVLAAPLIWFLLPEGRVWERVRGHAIGSTAKLLLTDPWRTRVAILAATTVLVAIVLQPAGLLYTVFASQDLHFSPAAISWLIFASGAVALVSYLAGGFISDAFGRRIPGVVLTAAYSMFAGLGFVTGAVGFVAGNVLWSAFASAATPVIGAWSGELYPTRARATAESVVAVAGAVGGIAGLQIVGAIASGVGLGRAIAAAGLAGLAGSFLLVFLPETNRDPLPD